VTTEPVQQELRALVAASQSHKLEQVRESINAMTVREMALASNTAKLLQRQGPAWIKDASPPQIEAFTRVATFLGLNPIIGEIYLMHGAVYVSMAGRLKLAQRTGEFDGISEPRMLTPEQQQVYGVNDGDIARLVEVWRKGRRMPAVGVGIIRKGELEQARSGRRGPDGLPFSPIGRMPEYMAAKRAQVAGLRQAFPDLDVAVVDLEERGVRGYVATTVDGEFVDEYEDAAPLAALREAQRSGEPFGTDAPGVIDVEPTPEHTEPQTPYEVILQAVAPILMTEQNADTIEDDANAALGSIGLWIEQYGDGTEAVQSAIEVAEAVAAELSAGAPSVALAADKVHRARAEAGQPFNAEAVAADAAPARSSRRQTAAQPPLE